MLMLFRFFCPLVFPDRAETPRKQELGSSKVCFVFLGPRSNQGASIAHQDTGTPGHRDTGRQDFKKKCWGAPLRNLLCRAQDVPPPRAPYRSNLLLVLLVPLQHRRVTESLLADPYYGSSTAFDKAGRVGPDPRSHRRAAAASAGRIVFCVHVLVHWKRRDACSCKNKLMHTM